MTFFRRLFKVSIALVVLALFYACPNVTPISDDDVPVDPPVDPPIDTTVTDTIIPPDGVYDPTEFIEMNKQMYNSGHYSGFLYKQDVYFLPNGAFFPKVEYVDTLAKELPLVIAGNRDVKIITEDTPCPDWSCIGESDWYILLTPGDYRDNGTITSIPKGHPNQYRVIRALTNDYTHPYDRPDEDKVFIEGSRFTKDMDWVYFYGLTIHGLSYSKLNGWDGKTYYGGGGMVWGDNTCNIIMDYCEVRNFLQGAMRIRGDNNGVQRTVFYDPVIMPGPKDRGGVGFEATVGEISENLFVIECEFVNMGDSYGAPWDDSKTGSIDGARFLSNDSWNDLPFDYISSGVYYDEEVGINGVGKGEEIMTEVFCGENIADFKGWSSDPLRPVEIAYNRGSRIRIASQTCGGTGSGGEGWVFHNNTRNYNFHDNLTRDVSNGIVLFGTNPKWSHIDGKPQSITVENNIFSIDSRINYRKREGRDEIEVITGLGIKSNLMDFHASNNTFVGIPYATKFSFKNKDIHNDNYYNCNVFHTTTPKYQENITNKYFSECNDETLVGPQEFTYDLIYWERRWTGPVRVVIPNIPYPTIKKTDECQCGINQKYPHG